MWITPLNQYTTHYFWYILHECEWAYKITAIIVVVILHDVINSALSSLHRFSQIWMWIHGVICFISLIWYDSNFYMAKNTTLKQILFDLWIFSHFTKFESLFMVYWFGRVLSFWKFILEELVFLRRLSSYIQKFTEFVGAPLLVKPYYGALNLKKVNNVYVQNQWQSVTKNKTKQKNE